jgi:hypothetical protein
VIRIFNQRTGNVFLRNFDEGVFATLGATPDPTSVPDPCYTLPISFGNAMKKVPVYFTQPEQIFKKMIYPFITVHRDEVSVAMHRWMGVGQLEYRAGVSGTQMVIGGVSGFAQYESKPQAIPHDITYTVSVWDRYEASAQMILQNVLKAMHPIGRLMVYDSLNLQRSYEYYWEGSIASLQELIDPVTRVRGYALSLRVEGELDLTQPVSTDAVTGMNLYLNGF